MWGYAVPLFLRNEQLRLPLPSFSPSVGWPGWVIDKKRCLITRFTILAGSRACFIPIITFSKQKVMGVSRNKQTFFFFNLKYVEKEQWIKYRYTSAKELLLLDPELCMVFKMICSWELRAPYPGLFSWYQTLRCWVKCHSLVSCALVDPTDLKTKFHKHSIRTENLFIWPLFMSVSCFWVLSHCFFFFPLIAAIIF